ncbi:EIF3G [Cordylochernes scorpioides]|uniref:Eukaryotic translation initiation factor 3 subunit G n=1 Tax=Cordylochernes scorpioides TaxID=51811 RepID=A0ABY6KSG6_9ARAC|nr:EIF3G [Cordylochernes scorpioides]
MYENTDQLDWADYTDDENLDETVEISGNIKTVTTKSICEETGRTKTIVKTYIIADATESSIARRKWKKYGQSKDDPPGRNPATTLEGEEIFMEFLRDMKEEKVESDLAKLQGKALVQCRRCKGEHWTAQCPYKDSMPTIEKEIPKETKQPEAAASTNKKYVPPSMRDGAGGRKAGDAMPRREDDTYSVKIQNLSEDTTENDLMELCSKFGKVKKAYMPKSKTGEHRGFGFVHFFKMADAEKAVQILNGFGYDNLILNAELAKPRERRSRNYESKPGPAALPHPPYRRPLSFSLNLEDVTTPLIFTDGSKSDSGVGAAIIFPSQEHQPILLRLHPDYTAFQAELLTILWAA